MDSKNNTLSKKIFYNEMSKTVKKLGKKHGFDIPDFNAMIKDGVMFMNITAFEGKSEDYYKRWYIENSKKIGMESEWIDVSFDNNEKNKRLEIVGMDPDGGEKCIKVKDQYGKFYHMTPAAVTRLIME